MPVAVIRRLHRVCTSLRICLCVQVHACVSLVRWHNPRVWPAIQNAVQIHHDQLLSIASMLVIQLAVFPKYYLIIVVRFSVSFMYVVISEWIPIIQDHAFSVSMQAVKPYCQANDWVMTGLQNMSTPAFRETGPPHENRSQIEAICVQFACMLGQRSGCAGASIRAVVITGVSLH